MRIDGNTNVKDLYHNDDELLHYGVLGMKWGVRRYQNKDGSLTEAGKRRIVKDSDMLGYDYRRKERKLKDPVINRRNVRNDERLKQSSDNYRKIAEQERARLLKEKTTLENAGYKFVKDSDSDLREHNNDILTYVLRETPAMKAAQKQHTELEVDIFADALLSDMRLQNTESAKAFVKDSLISNNTLVRTNLGLNRTESSRVADIKSRVTGKKENGKPAFLMDTREMAAFRNAYETRIKELGSQYRNSTDELTKQKLGRQIDQLENDYLDVVEQDFWYSDD